VERADVRIVVFAKPGTMSRLQRDRDRPFEAVVDELNREHRRRATSRRSRPPSFVELQRRAQMRWTVFVVVALAGAVLVGLLIPTH
jgi:hypothetical protein